MEKRETASNASVRWAILRRALLSSPPVSDHSSQKDIECISRKGVYGFNLIPCHVLSGNTNEELGASSNVNPDGLKHVHLCYRLPVGRTPRLVVTQRIENHVNLDDFEVCNQHDIDNTGIVCSWPSEDVLAYFCLIHAGIFRSKRVLELGSGYGIAGLVVAASTDAIEVVISDGNPQVVDS